LAVALSVLGPKRLPDLGRALGQGLKEFRGSLSGVRDEPSPRLGSASADRKESLTGGDTST
jgi:sec-independent protein translocase protein TatA